MSEPSHSKITFPSTGETVAPESGVNRLAGKGTLFEPTSPTR